jgi:2,5-diketo-D-gluconate reductase A
MIHMTSSTDASVPSLSINDGHRIPQLGFGVFQVDPGETTEVVAHALRVGYRHIDTAAAYRNEREVGEAVRASGLPRDALYLTTKLWNSDQGRDAARRAFERSLERLGDGFVDLYLIHWPVPSAGKYVETWKALVQLHGDGRARSIGVSNFLVEHLEQIIDATGVVPGVNQIELHPGLQQSELRAFHASHGILTEAWSPLGQGEALRQETVTRIAAEHDRTPAQVVIRWHLQLGNVVIPKSVTPSRIEENFDVFGFSLSDEEMRAIERLDAGHRIGPDPAVFAVGA